MGYNTSVLVLNDGLHYIENDPDFNKKLVRAISHLAVEDGPIDVSAGPHINACSVIESHHADATSLVAFGGNCGHDLGLIWPGTKDKDYDIKVLRDLADKLGYYVRKKPGKK